jgi:hypothetical protein
MTLGNMRRQGVRNLIAYCLNDTCRHQALIEWEKLSKACIRCAISSVVEDQHESRHVDRSGGRHEKRDGLPHA